MSWHDSGKPVIDDWEVLATAELIRRLYVLPGGAVGGPLHVILEDGNTEDEHVHDSEYFGRADGRQIETYLCRRGEGTWVGSAYHHTYVDELYCSEELADLSRLVLTSFRRMPEAWRDAAIAWADGSAWDHVQRLVAGTLCVEEPRASTGEVERLIAELRQAEDAPPPDGPKICAPVPCPPFKPPLLWVETTGDFADPYVAPPPQVDGARDAAAPPRPRYAGFDGLAGLEASQRAWAADPQRESWEERARQQMGRTPQASGGWQARFDQWLDNPDWDTSAAPLLVGVPDGTDIDELSQAIRLCQHAGLLPATPNGVMYIPAELVPPGSEEE